MPVMARSGLSSACKGAFENRLPVPNNYHDTNV